MTIAILARDELIGIEVMVRVFDGTSTGPCSEQKAREILAQQALRYGTLLSYVSHE